MLYAAIACAAPARASALAMMRDALVRRHAIYRALEHVERYYCGDWHFATLETSSYAAPRYRA